MNIQSKIRTLVYALCMGGGGVSNLYAQAPNTVIDTIPTSSFLTNPALQFIAISHDGSTAYAPDTTNHVIYAINTTDFSITDTIPVPNVGFFSVVTYIAITPDGTMAYFTNSKQINILSIPSNIITGTVPAVFNEVGGIAFTSDGNTAYVADRTNSTVSIIDVQDNTFTGIVNDTAHPFSTPSFIAITPATITPTKVYVTDHQSSVPVNVVEGAAVIAQVSGASSVANGIAITPNGVTAYVAIGSRVNTIDVTSHVITGTVSGGTFTIPFFIAITPDGTTAYVTDQLLNTVSIINLATNAVTGTVSVGTHPQGLAITPDGQEVWVVNQTARTISIIGYAISNLINLQGCQMRQVVLGQTNLINILTWQAPTRGTPTGYDIYRDAALTDLAGTVSASANPLEFSDPNRQPGVLYTYYIVAVDSSGVASATNVITVTQQCNYVISPVVNARGCQAKNAFLTQTKLVNKLTWQPPTTGTPVSYIIYRDVLLTDVAGTVLATANPLQFVDYNGQSGVRYTYYIIAVDASGNTSAPSVIPVTQACSKK